MKEKLNVGELIKTGVILFLITALSAALLAFVNSKTAPIIEQNDIEKQQNAMRAVLPDAADFDEPYKDKALPEEIAALSEKDEITNVYTALDKSGEVIGVCVITETTGYDIGIVTVTGVSADLKVTGVEITSMKETPGLGAKAQDKSFCEQYNGKGGEIGVSKTAADDTSIQAISGATKTSNGVTRGVNLALQTAAILMEGGDE